MCKTNESPKNVWRFPPCPGYDIEATESWLESMAEQGYVLSEDGFFLGFACFHPSTPQKIRYRLDVPIRKKGIFTENPDGPTQEEEALSRESGWRYITKRGDFYVFACDDPNAPEYHTDPQVQALSLRKIRNGARNNLISTIIWLGIYLIFSGIWAPLSTWISLGTPLALAWNLLLIWSILDSLASALYLRRLWKRLKDGAPPNHKKEWKSRARRHRVSIVGYFCLIVLCVGLFLGKWGAELTEENQIPLAEYTGALPFASMEDLVEQGSFSPQDSFDGNTIEITSDLLAPQILSFSQMGTGITKNGQQLSGGIRVDYVQTLTPWMAQELAREWASYDRWKNQKYYADLAVPEDLPVDNAFAYSAIFPTLVVTKGNQVVRYMFYQTSETYTMPLEEWGKIVAESLSENTEGK